MPVGAAPSPMSITWNVGRSLCVTRTREYGREAWGGGCLEGGALTGHTRARPSAAVRLDSARSAHLAGVRPATVREAGVVDGHIAGRDEHLR